MPTISDYFVVQSGHVLDRERLVFATYDPDATRQGVPNAQFFILKGGEWSQRTLDWEAVGIASVRESMTTCVVVGRDGQVLIADRSGFREELVDDRGVSPRRRGPLRGVRSVDSTVLVVGMGRQVYRREGPGTWSRLETGLPEQRQRGQVVGFNAIDGASIRNLYAAGWAGEIWHYDGRVWQQTDSPTNLVLFDVLTVEPDLVYICGKGGVLLRGHAELWEAVAYEGPRLEFRSMAWFADRLYLADGHSVHVLEDDELQLVDFGVGGEAPVPAHQLHANDGVLLTVAGKEAYTTKDGAVWEAVPL